MQAEGYLFVELYVVDLAAYVALFRDALGMRVIEDDGDFVKLRSSHGTVLLNSMPELPAVHAFANYRSLPKRGAGVELGFVTRARERARTAAKGLPGFEVTEVQHQEWGMSDFRVLTPEGYFLRVTTPDPA